MSTTREFILLVDGQYWAVNYNQGLTEEQHIDFVDRFDGDPVTATLMDPYEVTVTRYRQVTG